MRRLSLTFLMLPVVAMSAGCSDDGTASMGTAGSTTMTSGPADDTTTTTTTTSPTEASTGEPDVTGDDSTGAVTTANTETSATTSADESGDSTGTDTGGTAALVVYVNFDGVDLVEGATDDAAADTSEIAELAGPWSALDAGRAATVLAGIEALFAPFAIEVTDTRPAAGPYTMLVLAADAPPFAGAGGLAVSDCDDTNPSNVAIVFDDPAAAYSTQEVINIAGFQLGVTVGLNPVEGSDDDIMTSVLGDQGRTFTAACATEAEFAACTAASDACDMGEQSSFEEMLGRFGAA